MALSKFLDPKNDIAFKRVFGSENHKDILIHFINDIILEYFNLKDFELLLETWTSKSQLSRYMYVP